MSTLPEMVDGSHSDSPPRHFFKVVLFPIDQGLKIPVAFMRRFGHDLHDTVLLKVSTGDSWKLELAHYGDRTLLQNGWEEFVKYYSIKMFSFLVFRYEGNSQFNVLIFDPSALEIEYPFETNTDRGDNLSQNSGQRGRSSVAADLEISEDIDDDNTTFFEPSKQNSEIQASKRKRARVLEDFEKDVSIEILDDLSKCKPKTRSYHKLMIENPHFTGKNVAKADTKNPPYHTRNSGHKKMEQHQDGNLPSSKQKMIKGESLLGTRWPLQLIVKPQFKSSYEKSQAFRSSKPFFISVMRPYMVSKYCELQLPMKFAKEYLSVKKKSEFVLHVPGKIKSWPVRLHTSWQSGIRGRISVGWKKFVLDNSLKVNDVCVFEFVVGTANFNIIIYSSTEDEIAP